MASTGDQNWGRRAIKPGRKPGEPSRLPTMPQLEQLRQSPLAAEIEQRVRERAPMKPIKQARIG